jgi:hypothetical protein
LILRKWAEVELSGRCENIDAPVDRVKAGVSGQLDEFHDRQLSAVEHLKAGVVEGIRLVMGIRNFVE